MNLKYVFISPKSENYYHCVFQVVSRTEKDSHIVAFSDEMVRCPVTTDMSLQQVLMAMNQVKNYFIILYCVVMVIAVVHDINALVRTNCFHLNFFMSMK